MQALALWPRSAELLAMLAEAGEAARSSARLRRDLSAARQVHFLLPASCILGAPRAFGPMHGHLWCRYTHHRVNGSGRPAEDAAGVCHWP
jgi:hypothetical protein